MKKYPKYKPSGVEWIGEVPEHWEVKRLKRLAKICNGQDHKNVWTEDGEYPIIGTGGEFGRANSFLSNGPSVILGRKGTIDKPQFIEHPFWSVDTAYFTEIYNFTDPKFFYYCCTTIQFDRYKYGSAVPSMTQETLNQIPFATPPLPEQTAIAAYLDRKTAQIDQTIAEKERLIELFREERQAIINHAVTKGIRPGVKMKNSGVDWIGEVPEHWEVKKLKYVADIFGRIGFRGYTVNDIVEEGQGVITLSPGNIKNDILTLESATYLSFEKYYESPEIMIFPNDIVLVKTGSTIGKTAIIPKGAPEMTLNPQLVVLKNVQTVPKFLYYQTTCPFFKNTFEVEQTGGTTPTISQEKINSFPVFVPSAITEQQEIAEYLDQKTAQINAAISGIQQEIALLQEYRQALIFEAVTGKIDVREYAQN